MATSASVPDVSVASNHRKAQNRLAQRRHRQKKALEKQAALEETLTNNTGTQYGLQNYTEPSLSVEPTNSSSIASFPTASGFPGPGFAILGERFPLWDGSISTTADSLATISPSSNLTPSTNLIPLSSTHNFETLEAIRSAAMAFRRTIVPRPNPVFSNNRNETLVHTAARGNDVATLQLLVQYGFPMFERDSDGRTALHAAYEEHHMEAILWLLEYGIDVNAIDKQGRSALSMAVNNECPTAVKLFLSHGANPFPTQMQQLSLLSPSNEV